MATPEETLEGFRDEHALLCESYALSLEQIGEQGTVDEFDSHRVTFGDHVMLGNVMTTVGVGESDPWIPYQHALGEDTLTEEQKIRAAILFCSARLITKVYDSKTARYALRSHGIRLSSDEGGSALLAIASGDTDVLRQRGSQLHNWMAIILQRVIGDPYYEQFRNV